MEILRQLFRVHKGEGLKVLHFAMLGALIQAGVAIGISTGDSLFIANVGADKLPWIYMIMPAVMFVFVLFYSFLIARFPVHYVLYVSLGLVMAGAFAFYHVLGHGHPARLAYYFAKIFAGIWFIALYTVYWNLADNYFDIQDAKRLYPVFSGGGATGAMIGGILVDAITKHLSVNRLYLVWLIVAALSCVMAWVLVRKWKTIDTDDEPEDAGSVFSQIKGTFASLGSSSYVRMFLAILFLGVVLNTINEYQYSHVFQFKGYSEYSGSFSNKRTAAEVAQIFGSLFAYVNILNLLVNFFLFNWLVNRIGVGNMTLIGPVTYLITFVVLLMDYGKGAAILGFFAYQGVITSIDWNNANFLFNAVPASFKAQVRTFAEGLLEPLATAAAGVLLYYIGVKQWLPSNISTIGLIIAAVYFVIALGVRGGYLGAIVSNLKQEWLDFSRPQEVVLRGVGPEEKALLLERAQCADCLLAHAAIRILWQNDRGAAVDCLLNIMSRGAEEMTSSVPLLETMLDSRDPDVDRRIAQWLETSKSALIPRVVEALGERGLVPAGALVRPAAIDPDQWAATVAASWNSWDESQRRSAVETADILLKGSPEEASGALRGLGRTAYEPHAYLIVPLFTHADAGVRREALAAVARLATADSTRLIPPLLQAIQTGDTEDREICMDTLAKIGAVECIVPLLKIAELFTPYERRKTERVLREIGLKSVPATVAVLRDPAHSYVARSIAARALAQIAFPQLESISPPIIHAEIRRAYAFFNYRQSLTQGGAAPTAGSVVLARYYSDMQAIVVDFVLEILSLGGRLPDFELISASLRSDNRRDRGNAIETIEQGVDRDVFKMLLPLIDRSRGADDIDRALRRSQGAVDRVTPAQVATVAAASSSPIEAAAGAQALWDADRQGTGESLCALLRRSPDKSAAPDYGSIAPLLRDTVVSLLCPEPGVLNPIERIKLLIGAPLFEALHTQDLAVIAESGTQISTKPGEALFQAGKPAVAVYVVADGAVVAGGERIKAGGVAGIESMLGADFYAADAVSEGASVLRIPTEHILNAARTYSNIATALLAHKLGVGYALPDEDNDEEDDIIPAGAEIGVLRT